MGWDNGMSPGYQLVTRISQPSAIPMVPSRDGSAIDWGPHPAIIGKSRFREKRFTSSLFLTFTCLYILGGYLCTFKTTARHSIDPERLLHCIMVLLDVYHFRGCKLSGFFPDIRFISMLSIQRACNRTCIIDIY